MAKFGNLIGTNQIADNAVGYAELSVALQGNIDQIAVNQTNISNIVASKGAANGIATLGADGKLLSAQIPAIAVSDFLGEVSSEAGLLALTGQRGDWAIRTDNKTSYMLIGEDATQAANWKAIVTPDDGVTALRNASGTVSGQNGVVTLANVAFSGAANDVSFSDASFTATTVAAALVEAKAAATTAATAASNVANDVATLTTTVGSKVSLTGITPYLPLTGTIDGSNKTFTSSVALAGAKVLVMVGGQVINPTDYSIAGNDVVFGAVSPDHEYQRPAVMILKAA